MHLVLTSGPGRYVKAINPFVILDIDESATREEIDAAHRRLVRSHHPDRHVGASADERRAAEQRVAEINYAHELLTDPATAAAHKRRFERVRAAGHRIEPAPQRRPEDAPRRAEKAGTRPYREAAMREFTVGDDRSPVPWAAPRRRRRWFGRP